MRAGFPLIKNAVSSVFALRLNDPSHYFFFYGTPSQCAFGSSGVAHPRCGAKEGQCGSLPLYLCLIGSRLRVFMIRKVLLVFFPPLYFSLLTFLYHRAIDGLLARQHFRPFFLSLVPKLHCLFFFLAHASDLLSSMHAQVSKMVCRDLVLYFTPFFCCCAPSSCLCVFFCFNVCD